MRLYDIQNVMGVLLLQKQGADVIANQERWKAFCDAHGWGAFYKEAPPQTFEMSLLERLKLYQELLFVSVESTLSALYPFCRRFFTKEEWYALAEDYRRHYPNDSYQLYMAVKSFPDFLAQLPQSDSSQKRDILQRIPFLVDLARYEWLEVALLHAPNSILPESLKRSIPDTDKALLDTAPFWNPISTLLHCDYAIPLILSNISNLDEISADYTQVTHPQPVDILLYRDPETLSVRFFQFSNLTAGLFSLAQAGQAYQQVFMALKASNSQLNTIDSDVLTVEGLKFMAQCHQEGILLGSVSIAA